MVKLVHGGSIVGKWSRWSWIDTPRPRLSSWLLGTKKRAGGDAFGLENTTNNKRIVFIMCQCRTVCNLFSSSCRVAWILWTGNFSVNGTVAAVFLGTWARHRCRLFFLFGPFVLNDSSVSSSLSYKELELSTPVDPHTIDDNFTAW